jgi:UDP-N-acetylmuramoyl-tripeptide--D-alanyl-D-alanine ligase
MISGLRHSDIEAALGPLLVRAARIDPDRVYARVAPLSERVVGGALFARVEGAYDGGEPAFLDAVMRGASGLLCRVGQAPAIDFGLNVLEVSDTLAAYRRIAGLWRDRFSLPIAVVAGSVGKTTTKEMLAAMLRGHLQSVLATVENLNGYVGIPTTLLEIGPAHRAAVVEVGIDARGAMAEHIALVRPTHAVVSAIGIEHLEGLSDLATVATEELVALSGVADVGGTVAVNLDDPWVRAWADRLSSGRRIGFSLAGVGVTPGRDVLVGEIDAAGTSVRVTGLGMEGDLPMVLPGVHNARNLLGAAVLASALGASLEEMVRGLAGFVAMPGRSQIVALASGVRVICDFYNASPPSMLAALALLDGDLGGAAPRSRWACLGDMLELGAAEEELHRALAAPIRESRVDHVLLAGPRMRWLYDELRARGFSADVSHHSAIEDLAARLGAGVVAGDLVLLKGSRAMAMEKVLPWLGGTS